MSIQSAFKNLRVATKVGGGFAVVLILLAVTAGAGYVGLDKANGSFLSYEESARQRNQINRVAYTMQRVRVNVRNFILAPDEAAAKQTFDRIELVQKEIGIAKERMASRPDLLPMIEKLDGWNKEWKKEFQAVVDFQDQRNKQVRDVMDKVGPEMDGQLNQLMENLKKDGNAEGVFLASGAQRHLLLIRFYMQRFLRTNEDVEIEQVKKQVAALEKVRTDLEKAAPNADDKAVIATFRDSYKKYMTAWEAAVKAITARNQSFKVAMTQLGDNMVKTGDDLTNVLRDFQESLGERAEADNHRTVVVTLVTAAVAFTLGLLAAWLIGSGIARSIRTMTEAMGRLAEGDLDVEIPARDQKDEIGSMATSVQVFKDNAIEKVRLEAEQEEKDRRAAQEKRDGMLRLADAFESSVGKVVGQVSAAATQMQSSSEAMSATAEETTRQASAVAAASEQASANVQTVASAAEELSSSIAEISRQVSQASEIASAAVKEAEQTNVKVQGLAQAANKIGEVVALITDIAEQTNLLALNATIEAARAGDAGKGFAVVASEVKNLANQTAKATEEIGAQISGIQSATQEAVSAIETIGKTIAKINEVNAGVASAVEEQGAATQEIARNVEQAAAGTQEVSTNISGVSQAANDTGAAAVQIQSTAGDLSRQSEMLRAEVDKFLANVRAA